jgi:transcriptional regulator GlxA family with amidase domain
MTADSFGKKTIAVVLYPGLTVRRYVRTAAASAEVVGSVCTGSLILGAVGLLADRQAATN